MPNCSRTKLGSTTVFFLCRLVFVLASQIFDMKCAREACWFMRPISRKIIRAFQHCAHILCASSRVVASKPHHKPRKFTYRMTMIANVRARLPGPQQNVSYIVFNKWKTVYHLTAFYHFRQTPRGAHLIVDTN